LPVDELTGFIWRELGASMRRLRTAAHVSIRMAETRSGYSRGMLSLAENGKARPGRALVRWYDETFAANGLLLSLYAEALTAALPSSRAAAPPTQQPGTANGDALALVACDPAPGVIVFPGTRVLVRWTVRNTGEQQWTGRCLERMGAVDGSLVLSSARKLDVPDTAPGDQATVECELVAPERPGAYVGCWALVDGSPAVPSEHAAIFFAVVVV